MLFLTDSLLDSGRLTLDSLYLKRAVRRLLWGGIRFNNPNFALGTVARLVKTQEMSKAKFGFSLQAQALRAP